MLLASLPALVAIGLNFTAAAAASSSSSFSGSATQTTTLAIPAGTVVGSVVGGVEYYRGIPFAHPPVGPRRLKPPMRLERFDTVHATGVGPACPQMIASNPPPLFLQVLTEPGVAAALLSGDAQGDITEDCLTVSVMRPQGTAPNAKLPVLFWIYGGGFELGSPQPYNGSVLIPQAVAQGKPFVLVAVNYRLGAFGFLGGREVLAGGCANLGLLDQRMGLEWVADNIAAFGGNPAAVTIWGESAGSVSVFDQLALYDGNHTYRGRPLFRAVIMNSGSISPSEPVDGVKAQTVFDTVVHTAGCGSQSDKLACLRQVDSATFQNASNSVPTFLSYNSLSLSYMPRPDGKTLTASPDVLAKHRQYAAVPVIIGDLEDEGTLFALFQANISTQADLITYLNDVVFHNATREDIAALVATYPDRDGAAGSPFGTGSQNQAYREFKRLAAILGDVGFILTRRHFLTTLPPSVPAWSFLATWGKGTPILGTFHTSDLPRVFYGHDPASRAMQDRYIAFVHSLDPNDGVAFSPTGHRTFWPRWQEKRQLIEFSANSTSLISDDFRPASFGYIQTHLDVLRL